MVKNHKLLYMPIKIFLRFFKKKVDFSVENDYIVKIDFAVVTERPVGKPSNLLTAKGFFSSGSKGTRKKRLKEVDFLVENDYAVRIDLRVVTEHPVGKRRNLLKKKGFQRTHGNQQKKERQKGQTQAETPGDSHTSQDLKRGPRDVCRKGIGHHHHR